MSDIKKLDGIEERMETGVVQFGDDWPGLFIRGDNCIGYAAILEESIVDMKDGIHKRYLQEFIKLLMSVTERE